MNSHDTERAYVAAMLDIEQEKFDRATAKMEADLDALRSDLTAGYSEMIRANQEHARRVEADRRAWLASFTDGDEPTQEPAQHRPQEASAPGPGTVGAGRPNPPNPHAADLERAEDIYGMSMQEYAKRRAEFGIRSATDMSHLFG